MHSVVKEPIANVFYNDYKSGKIEVIEQEKCNIVNLYNTKSTFKAEILELTQTSSFRGKDTKNKEVGIIAKN